MKKEMTDKLWAEWSKLPEFEKDMVARCVFANIFGRCEAAVAHPTLKPYIEPDEFFSQVESELKFWRKQKEAIQTSITHE